MRISDWSSDVCSSDLTVRAPVRVLFTRVNGEPYYEAGTSVPTLAAGDRVVLRREPDNPHDRRAIEVLDARGAKLGYVARIDNSAGPQNGRAAVRERGGQDV